MIIEEMSILVLGASSFIGRSICKNLNARKIIAVIRPGSERKMELERLGLYKSIEIIEYDIFNDNNYEMLEKQVSECDVYIMLAWQGTKREERNQPLLHECSCKILFECMKKHAEKFPLCKFIMCGTQAEYGKQTGTITEKAVCEPVTEYGRQKYQFYKTAMAYSNEHNLKFIELRFHSVIGKYDYPDKMIQQVIHKLQDGEWIYMNSDCSQMWNFIGIEELCKGIEKAVSTDLVNGAYNIGSVENYELRKYLTEISRIVCGEERIIFDTAKDENAPDFVFCCDKFFNAVHWKPQKDFEKQIKKITGLEK